MKYRDTDKVGCIKSFFVIVFCFVIIEIVPLISLRVYLFTHQSAPADTVVYITETGDCYHKGDCSTLKSKHKTTLEYAWEHDYSRCQNCKPPTRYYKIENHPSISKPFESGIAAGFLIVLFISVVIFIALSTVNRIRIKSPAFSSFLSHICWIVFSIFILLELIFILVLESSPGLIPMVLVLSVPVFIVLISETKGLFHIANPILDDEQK